MDAGRFRKGLLSSLLLLGVLLAACSTGGPPAPEETTPAETASITPQTGPTDTPAPTLTPTQPTPTPEATPTPLPRELVVCLGQEPESLYLYSGDTSTSAKNSVLEAIYDGPIDTNGYSYQAVILEKIPSLADGDALIQAVEARVGDLVVAADGSLVLLQEGAEVLPSGCHSRGCAITHEGDEPLVMDRIVVTFRLRSGVTWSDGTPVTVYDSVYSYQIAADAATPGEKFLIDRTAGYEALDNLTVQWTGLPGFKDATYFNNFWSPLPEHVLGVLSAAQLLDANEARRAPLGWGPYVLDRWIAGESITLFRNENYFRAAEGLPIFDTLVYRFIGEDSDAAIAQLLSGDCDLLGQSIRLEGSGERLLNLDEQGIIQAGFQPTTGWEHLDFGITPFSFEDGWVAASDRPDYFGDPRTRQAFALCIDRQKIVDTLLYGKTLVPDGYLPPDHPAHNDQLPRYDFDAEAGSLLLEEIGWVDGDEDGVREYSGDDTQIPSGTRFEVSLTASDASPRRQQVLALIAEDLARCGILASLEWISPAEFFAYQEEARIFGRQFDLMVWGTETIYDCQQFLTAQIPGPGNGWNGLNPGGYKNPELDAACARTQEFLPSQLNQIAESHLLAQQIFAEQLPVMPLFLDLKIGAARADMCSFSMSTTDSDLWNIESLDYGECTPP